LMDQERKNRTNCIKLPNKDVFRKFRNKSNAINIQLLYCLSINQSINQSISANHLHKNDQWLTNKVKNNKTKIKPNE